MENAVTSISLEELKRELDALNGEVHRLQRAQSSRIGSQGVRGEKGETGTPGRDAKLSIIQEGNKVTLIDLFTEKPVAELVTIPGKDGVSPAKPKDGVDGRPGVDGKDGISPSVEAIAREVVKILEARICQK